MQATWLRLAAKDTRLAYQYNYCCLVRSKFGDIDWCSFVSYVVLYDTTGDYTHTFLHDSSARWL